VDGRISFARAMLKGGRSDAARHALQAYLGSNPKDPDALYMYGAAAYRENDDTGAARAFQALVAASPSDKRAHYSLGITLARMNRLDEARRCFERALQIDPAFGPARQRLAELGGPPAQNGRSGRPPVNDEKHLRPGELLAAGHRRLSSFAGRFAFAAAIAAAGIALIQTQTPGRLRWLAEFLQWPSLGFLRDAAETTGQPQHREELQEALEATAARSEFFDGVLSASATGLLVVAAVVVLHALSSGPMTRYKIYERRIDVATGVLSRRQTSTWLYEIDNVEFEQSPALTLSHNAAVVVYLPPRPDAKPSRLRKDRSKLRIIGFGRFRHQLALFGEIRDAALIERRAMRNWWV